MIEQLFGSKTRVKLLQLFFNNPNRAFYVREITRKIDEQINSVRRELANLLQIGIIKSDSNNNRLYYEVNQKYKHYKALRSIFTDKQTISSSQIKVPDAGLATKISELGSVELALLTGKFTRDERSGIDMLIVGNINKNKLEKLINALEKEEGFEINYSVLSPEDFDYRRSVKDKFISDVLTSKKTILIDTKKVANNI